MVWHGRKPPFQANKIREHATSSSASVWGSLVPCLTCMSQEKHHNFTKKKKNTIPLVTFVFGLSDIIFEVLITRENYVMGFHFNLFVKL